MQPYSDANRSTQLKILLIVVLFAVFVILSYSLIQSQRFHVVSTNPTLNNISNVSPFLKINFNEQLSDNGLFVSSSPFIINSYKTNDKTLVINFNTPLSLNTKYLVTISNVSDKAGKTITKKTFSFVPKNIPANDLPNDQQQAQLNRQAKYSGSHNDPILPYLPYSTLDYSLNTTSTTDENHRLILQAQLLIAPGVTGEAETADVNQYRQEVIDYIKSVGLNPDNYDIQYPVVNETITGP